MGLRAHAFFWPDDLLIIREVVRAFSKLRVFRKGLEFTPDDFRHSIPLNMHFGSIARLILRTAVGSLLALQLSGADSSVTRPSAQTGGLKGNGVPIPMRSAKEPAPLTSLPAAAPSAPAPAPTAYPATVVVPKEEKGLLLDATAKEYTAKPGEEKCTFTFHVTNISSAEITIIQVRTSCGCSVAELPSKPWKLAPHASGDFTVAVDLRAKSGVLVKTATLDTPTSFKVVTMKITIPTGNDLGNRSNNMQMAATDRQAVFKGDCARCHAAPTAGQMGEALYLTACAICHDAEHRASMVPDLRTLTHETNRDFWQTLIREGKSGTLMPAFSADRDGPLSSEQIDSLADYLAQAFSPRHPAKAVTNGSK